MNINNSVKEKLEAKYAEEIIKSYGYDFLNFEEKKQETGLKSFFNKLFKK